MNASLTNSPYDGVHTALLTPFLESGKIDYFSLRKLVDLQLEQGVSGLVPVGTTGESPTLSHKEHVELIKSVCQTASESSYKAMIIAGTGSNNTIEAIELTKAAQDLGCGASLQVIPYYNKPSQEGLYQHFIKIAEHTDIPLILYNIPGRSAVALSVETIIRLAEHPRIVAIKEATGAVNTTIALSCKVPDFVVLSGDDPLSLAMIAHGARGLISVASNIVPNPIVTMVSEALKGQMSQARTIYARLYELFSILFSETNPIPVKYAASRLGLCQLYYRLPLCEPSEFTKAAVEKRLADLDNFPNTLIKG